MTETLQSTNGTNGVGPANALKAQPEKAELEGSVSIHSKFWAALRAMAPMAPFTAVGITILAYMENFKLPAKLPALLIDIPVPPLLIANSAVAVGSLAAVITWLILAVCYRPYTGADSVSLRNYSQLQERLGRLDVRIKHACPKGYKPLEDIDSELLAVRRLACNLAKNERDELRRGLKRAGMPWVRGLGYIELWHRVHRAEEALTKVEPYSEALGGARRDQSRLEHAHMKNRDALLKRLKAAICKLENSKEAAKPQVVAEALNTLSEVQYEINHFRDDVWEGIVHARNRFSDTSVMLGVTAYTLLSLAIFTQPPPPALPSEAVLWVSVYFLTGAIIGLFARAQAEWNMNTAIDDFGLSFARLINTPWLSGLAAVGGVLLTSVLGGQLLGAGAEESSNLTNIFRNAPSFLIVAAVFGLAPDLIIRRLMQQVESYKEDLQSTKSAQSTTSAQGGNNSRPS